MKSYGQVASQKTSFSDPKGITSVKMSHDYLPSTTATVAIYFTAMTPFVEVLNCLQESIAIRFKISCEQQINN